MKYIRLVKAGESVDKLALNRSVIYDETTWVNSSIFKYIVAHDNVDLDTVSYELYTANGKLPLGINTTLPEGTVIHWHQYIDNIYSGCGLTISYNQNTSLSTINGNSVNTSWGNLCHRIYNSKKSHIYNRRLYYKSGTVSPNTTVSEGYSGPSLTFKSSSNNNIGSHTSYYGTNYYSLSTGTVSFTNYVFQFQDYDLTKMFNSCLNLLPTSESKWNEYFPNLNEVPHEPGIDLVSHNGKLFKISLPSYIDSLYTGSGGEIPEGIACTLPNGTPLFWNQYCYDSFSCGNGTFKSPQGDCQYYRFDLTSTWSIYSSFAMSNIPSILLHKYFLGIEVNNNTMPTLYFNSNRNNCSCGAIIFSGTGKKQAIVDKTWQTYVESWFMQQCTATESGKLLYFINPCIHDITDMFSTCPSLCPTSVAGFNNIFPDHEKTMKVERGIHVVVYNNKLYKLKLPSNLKKLYTGTNNEIPSGISSTLPDGTILMWNCLIKNGDFSSSGNWNIYDASKGSISISNQIATLNYTASGSGYPYGLHQVAITNFYTSNKYFVQCMLNPSKAFKIDYELANGIGLSKQLTASVWQIDSNVITPPQNGSTFIIKPVNVSSVSGDTMKFKYVNVVNLNTLLQYTDTQINTQEQFLNYFPNFIYAPYDEGTRCMVYKGKLYELK